MTSRRRCTRGAAPVPGAARAVTIWTIWMVVNRGWVRGASGAAWTAVYAQRSRRQPRGPHGVARTACRRRPRVQPARDPDDEPHRTRRAARGDPPGRGGARIGPRRLDARRAAAVHRCDAGRARALDADGVVQATPTVQVGPIGINPRQVMELGQAVQTAVSPHVERNALRERRRARAACGDVRRRKRTAAPWHASVTASAGRATCLADVAAQVVVAMSTEKVLTSNAQSLRQYVAGLDALTGATSDPASLAPARQAFNARSTRAATTGSPISSRDRLPPARRCRRGNPPSARRIGIDRQIPFAITCGTRPDFGYLVLYQLGSALTQSGGWMTSPKPKRVSTD